MYFRTGDEQSSRLHEADKVDRRHRLDQRRIPKAIAILVDKAVEYTMAALRRRPVGAARRLLAEYDGQALRCHRHRLVARLVHSRARRFLLLLEVVRLQTWKNRVSNVGRQGRATIRVNVVVENKDGTHAGRNETLNRRKGARVQPQG